MVFYIFYIDILFVIFFSFLPYTPHTEVDLRTEYLWGWVRGMVFLLIGGEGLALGRGGASQSLWHDHLVVQISMPNGNPASPLDYIICSNSPLQGPRGGRKLSSTTSCSGGHSHNIKSAGLTGPPHPYWHYNPLPSVASLSLRHFQMLILSSSFYLQWCHHGTLTAL